MYRPFFDLSDLPFRSTPDLDYFYKDADREELVSAILYSLDRGDGIIKVVGEVGSGKTTLLRRISQKLSLDYQVVYINSPNLSSHDILFFICHEFGIPVDPQEQKFFLVSKLRDFFIQQHALGRQPLILIDEAQAMPIETLEEIRLLLNLETDQHKLVQVVLFGQPELDSILSKPEIRQFQSRISHAIFLPAFSVDDVKSYLNFRMRKAGYQGQDLFGTKVAKLISKLSKGLPRDIHVLADRALLAAYSEGTKLIKPRHIVETNFFMISLFKWFVLIMVISIISWIAIHFNYETVSNEHIQTDAVESDLDELKLKSSIESKVQPDELFSEYSKAVKSRIDTIQLDSSMLYSVQLMTSDLSNLEMALKSLQSHGWIDPQQLFYSINSKRNQFTLYYGYFSGYSKAINFVDSLPNFILAGQPFIVSKSQVLSYLSESLQNNQKPNN
ncbi:ExeA family protein [Thiomicrospira pelophila]|uniref:ExeA family protein n=1 Tax=Thiomicrospira pelophila TaxID=934 RepID=UPI00068D8F90|nr:AAA family ATPase [Thiomicrospira pelophila]